MFRVAPDGYKKSLGKDHEDTERSVLILARLLKVMGRHTDLQKVLNAYSNIKDDSDWYSDEGGDLDSDSDSDSDEGDSD